MNDALVPSPIRLLKLFHSPRVQTVVPASSISVACEATSAPSAVSQAPHPIANTTIAPNAQNISIEYRTKRPRAA